MRKRFCQSTRLNKKAFTLLEVMIAAGLFFIAVFAILELTTRSLRAARGLQQDQMDASTVASLLVLTNQLEEGSESGNLSDILGPKYNGFSWSWEIFEVASNGLFRADVSVIGRSEYGQLYQSQTSLLLYRPGSVQSIRSISRSPRRNR